MAVDTLDDCGIYFGTTGGQVYCSPDGGDSWNAITHDLPAVLSMHRSPDAPLARLLTGSHLQATDALCTGNECT